MLDLGTGSGSLILSSLFLIIQKLKAEKRTDIAVYGIGIDISDKAIETAIENSVKLGLQDNCRFLHSEFSTVVSNLEVIQETQKFQVIISNPPYLPCKLKHEKSAMRVKLSIDPELAIFAGESGLEHYSAILKSSLSLLDANGWLIVEVGNRIGHQVASMFRKDMIWKDVEILKDVHQQECCVIGCLRASPPQISLPYIKYE